MRRMTYLASLLAFVLVCASLRDLMPPMPSFEGS